MLALVTWSDGRHASGLEGASSALEIDPFSIARRARRLGHHLDVHRLLERLVTEEVYPRPLMKPSGGRHP